MKIDDLRGIVGPYKMVMSRVESKEAKQCLQRPSKQLVDDRIAWKGRNSVLSVEDPCKQH